MASDRSPSGPQYGLRSHWTWHKSHFGRQDHLGIDATQARLIYISANELITDIEQVHHEGQSFILR
jgi:hypothetical protein